MAWVDVNLEVVQNETFSKGLLFFSPPPTGTDPADEVPVDFTGATAVLSARKGQNSTSAAVLALTSSPVLGLAFFAGANGQGGAVPSNPNGVMITITAAQSVLLEIGVWYYDIVVMWGSTKQYVARGEFKVVGSAAR